MKPVPAMLKERSKRNAKSIYNGFRRLREQDPRDYPSPVATFLYQILADSPAWVIRDLAQDCCWGAILDGMECYTASSTVRQIAVDWLPSAYVAELEDDL